MKKELLTILAAAAVSAGAWAEGYQVNSYSARQEGMGHTGVALHLGAESQVFNPAQMAFSTKTMEIGGSVSGIFSKVKALTPDGEYETNSKASTPLSAAASFRIYDNLYAGVAFFTPYGSGINWGMNWPGAVLNQSVSLKVYTLQPTVAWRILPNLSVGAGLMIAWGNVNLSKGLVSASSFDRLLDLMKMGGMLPAETPGFGNVSPASVNLKGTANTTVGVNAGIAWDINRQWSVGASFRSKMTMTVKAGDVRVSYANELAKAVLGAELNNLDYTNFAASMPCPYVLTVGAAYKPIDKLTLAADVQLNGWGTYKSLDMEFAEQSQFNQHLVKNYHNAMTYHLGAQYSVTPRCDLRLGFMVDTTPVDNNYYNPETPGCTKWEPTAGVSFQPVKGLSVDVAVMYVAGSKVKNATGHFDDFIAPKYNAMKPAVLPDLNPDGTFTADYKLNAFVAGLGISYSF